MASNISNVIEEFIKSIFGDDEQVQLSRNDLANYFSVAPSQINYVLTTRFGTDKGYVIESRRGGGGYVTIIKLSSNPDELLPQIIKEVDELPELTYQKACNILERMVREDVIDEKESNLIKSAISDKALAVPLKANGLRKNIFKEIIFGLMRR
jgi:transcriptional regulator of stress and heat shock response